MYKSSVSVIAQNIAAKNNIKQSEAEEFIRLMFDVANEGLQRDKLVKVKWLGTFKVTSVKDRESVDVNTGERIVIEGRDKITFTPDNILREIVNKPFEQFETVVVNDDVDFDEIDRKFAIKEEEQKNVVEENDIPEASHISESSDNTDLSSDTLQTSQPTQFSKPSNVSETSLTSKPSAPSDTIESSVVSFDEIPTKVASDASDEVIIVGEDVQMENSKSDETEELAKEEEVDNLDESVNTGQPVESAKTEQSEWIEETNKVEKEVKKEEIKEAHTDESALTDDSYDDEPSGFMISKPLVVAACVIFVVLLGGMGWMAYSYKCMSERQIVLEQQIARLHHRHVDKQQTSIQTASPNAQTATQTVTTDTEAATLQQKAKEDSMRQMKVSEAVSRAEQSTELENKEAAKAKSAEKVASKVQTKDKVDVKAQTTDKKAVSKSQTTDKGVTTAEEYDKDVRVRTGAYRIVGVAQTIEVRSGQTLSGISKAYLGPGMECYVEALNGVTTVKAGQKLKIPKLVLKKKR